MLRNHKIVIGLALCVGCLGVQAKADAARVVDMQGNVVRVVQNWDNNASLKTPNFQVVVHQDPAEMKFCDDAEAIACTSLDGKDIYLGPDADPQAYYHELFHAMQFRNMDQPWIVNIQNLFMRLNRLTGAWWVDSVNYWNRPYEMAADEYGTCAAKQDFTEWPRVAMSRVVQVCKMFQRHMRGV